MPRKATLPIGLSTVGEIWMWHETERIAQVLNGVKANASNNLRYGHEDLEEAIRSTHLPLRRCRRHLARYAKINACRSYPAYALQNPEEAAGWDDEQHDLRARWVAALTEAMDAKVVMEQAYIEAVKEEK